MNLFVVDTDVLSLYERGHEIVNARIDAKPTKELAITIITVEEKLSGWYALLRRSKRRDQVAHAYQRLGETVHFLARWVILPYSEAAMRRYDDLKKQRIRIDASDLRIAAIALENNATLVTRNRRDFQQVPGLMIEDWSV